MYSRAALAVNSRLITSSRSSTSVGETLLAASAISSTARPVVPRWAREGGGGAGSAMVAMYPGCVRVIRRVACSTNHASACPAPEISPASTSTTGESRSPPSNDAPVLTSARPHGRQTPSPMTTNPTSAKRHTPSTASPTSPSDTLAVAPPCADEALRLAQRSSTRLPQPCDERSHQTSARTGSSGHKVGSTCGRPSAAGAINRNRQSRLVDVQRWMPKRRLALPHSGAPMDVRIASSAAPTLMPQGQPTFRVAAPLRRRRPGGTPQRLVDPPAQLQQCSGEPAAPEVPT